MYFIFRIKPPIYICISDSHLDTTFVLPDNTFLTKSLNLPFVAQSPSVDPPFIFYTPAGKLHHYGYVQFDKGITYAHMPLMRDLPKIGVSVSNWAVHYSFKKSVTPVIDEYSLDESEVGDLTKEKLNVYNISEEKDSSFDVYDTIKAMQQCKDVDTLYLYMLSALPYLNNCDLTGIVQFADVYNTKLWNILI